MGHWRNIVVDGKSYRWAGSSYVVVQDANGRRVFSATAPEIKGSDWNAWERGKWKRTTDGMIFPREIAALIRDTLGQSQPR